MDASLANFDVKQGGERMARAVHGTAVCDIEKHGKAVHHHRSRQASWHQPRRANLKALIELQKKAKGKRK
jgi:hypothetical protein